MRTERSRVAVDDSLRFLPGASLGTITVTGLADLGTDNRTRPRVPVTNDYQLSHEVTHRAAPTACGRVPDWTACNSIPRLT